VHISRDWEGNGPVTRVEETSRLKRFGWKKKDGRGPDREVRESCTKTRVGGRDEMVNSSFVLL
jgi:hypothetical protein